MSSSSAALSPPIAVATSDYQIKIVFIPAHKTQAVEEMTINVVKEKEVECLTDFCKAHFERTGGKAAADVLKKQIQEHMKLAQKNAENPTAPPQFDDAMMSAITGMQLVDVVSLLPNAKSNNYIAVNMYVDDKGIAKSLPINDRASELAQVCGLPTTVYGDAFISRLVDDDRDLFKRLDFAIEECDSAASWVKLANEFNTRARETRGGGADGGGAAGGKVQCFLLGCYEEGTMKCGACKKAAYCSKECQKEDWKRHKVDCLAWRLMEKK